MPSESRGAARRLLGLLLGLLACAGCGRDEAPAAAEQRVVIVEPVASRRLELEIVASGDLLAIEEAMIAAEIDGRISEPPRREGDRVAPGEVLLRIDPERRQLGVASAEASLAEARAARQEAWREHARVIELQRKGAASSAQVDAATTALEAAESRHDAAAVGLRVASRLLRDADVVAPFAGVIARRYVSRGEYVAPGTPLFELVASDPLEVVFQISEVDSGRVALGNPVSLQVASHPQESFTARVTMISPTIDPRTRTLRVKAELDNDEGRLRPGLFAHVRLGVDVREAVKMIPEQAVLQRASGPIAFVVDAEGRALRRSIETGLHRDGEVEVLAGLEHGEWVISQGHSRLVDGMLVAPRSADGQSVDLHTAETSGGRGPALP